MRIKAALIIAALSATAMPAAAQGCEQARANNQVGGAIVGGLLGGVLGSNVAASGHKHDGTALGAVLGGVVGAGVGGNVRCPKPTYQPGVVYSNGSNYNPNPNYGGQYYGGSGYGQPQPNYYPADPGYSSGYGDDDYGDYRDDPYLDGGRYADVSPRRRKGERVYLEDNRSYNRNEDFAGRDCSEVIQTTRLPDGTVIRRPVEACREARYGNWQVRD